MILVTGGTGQVGTAFRKILPDADYPGRAALDLADPAGVGEYLALTSPDGIINCGAYTAVDAAEENEALATCVNGASVGVMARYAADHGIPFVTFSTDYVFKGNATEPYLESSPTDPLNAYGRSKLAGEVAALENSDALVIRTSWVISGTHPNFVATMLRLAAERDLEVVDDQVGCPTCVDDLAPAALAAFEGGTTGIVHLTNEGVTTWFELARAALALAGLDPERITPIPTSGYPTPAARPAYSVLGSERRSELGMAPLPSWPDSLPAVVAALREAE